jgi:putative glutamine amidotransferase
VKPVIGICSDFSEDDSIGTTSGLGFKGQSWQLLADDYVQAIEKSGGIPIIIPVCRKEETLSHLLSRVDGLLLTGGSDIDPAYYGQLPRRGLGQINPPRDRHELPLVKMALASTQLPILGICRGHQMLNVATGGELFQDLQSERDSELHHALLNSPKYHPTLHVTLQKEARLHGVFKRDTLHINSFNHQGVSVPGEGFKPTMHAPDGLIEGVEIEGDRWVCSVQWHPETMIEHYPEYLALFEAFVKACSDSRGA